MPTPTNKYWGITYQDGSQKFFPVALSATCADRPSLATAVAGAIAKPTLAGYLLKAVGCALPTLKKRELFVGRNTNQSLSFYANGSGNLWIKVENTGATPSFSSEKQMTTVPSENTRPALFDGSAGYGSYFGSVPNGTYLVTWKDSDNATQLFNITVTDTGPVQNLYRTSSSGGGDGGSGGGGGTVTVKERKIIGATSIVEGVTDTQYKLRDILSNDTERDYPDAVSWSADGLPSGITINATTGVLALPSASISQSYQVTVKANFGNGQVVPLVVNLVDSVTSGNNEDNDYARTTWANQLLFSWTNERLDEMDIRIKEVLPNGRYKVYNAGRNNNNDRYDLHDQWIDPNTFIFEPDGIYHLVKFSVDFSRPVDAWRYQPTPVFLVQFQLI